MCILQGADIPECALRSNTEILENEPEACLALRIVEATSIDGVHTNQIAGMILVDGGRCNSPRHLDWALAVGVWCSIGRIGRAYSWCAIVVWRYNGVAIWIHWSWGHRLPILVKLRDHGRRHVHRTLWRRWIRCDSAT